MIAEIGPQPVTVAERSRIEAGHVAGEVVVLLGPVANEGEAGAEPVGHDVVEIADEDCLVTDLAVSLDLADHLCVVVGSDEGFSFPTLRHREIADEVGEPCVGGLLEIRILVQVIVESPRFVADHEVVLPVGYHLIADHEVGDLDLVHVAQRLEDHQVVLS